MTAGLLETHVFARPYFDRRALVVAEDGGRLAGFAHAAFGAAPDGSKIGTEVGAINVVQVAEHEQREAIARGLLERCEAYLTGGGARTLFAGCVQPAHGFYLGLYGGSESPGVLESDAATLTLFRNAGYVEVREQAILQRPRAVFRPPVDRQQMQIRRQYQVQSQADPPPTTWWEAWTVGQLDRVRHRLFARQASEPCGEVLAWNREHAPGDFGTPAVGLLNLQIQPELRGQGLGTFLVAEALRAMQGSGVVLVEVQADASNQPGLALSRKLGFQQVDRGWVLRKAG